MSTPPVKVIIKDVTPSSTPRVALPFTNVTNHISPERVDHWLSLLTSEVSSLPKGTGACSTVLGEAFEVDTIVKKRKAVESFKAELVLRELTVEVSHLPEQFFM
jgi:hypothetical protein